MDNILRILEENARLTNAEVSVLAGISEKEVEKKRAEYEKQGVIVGYKALVDWDKTDRELVTALIEIKVAPQKDMGFDKVADRISKHPEVRSVYLMSGGFDLTVIIEGKTMKEVALFVSGRLATMEGVTATATHFVLKKYKDEGVVFLDKNKDERGYTGV